MALQSVMPGKGTHSGQQQGESSARTGRWADNCTSVHKAASTCCSGGRVDGRDQQERREKGGDRRGGERQAGTNRVPCVFLLLPPWGNSSVLWASSAESRS